MYDEKSCGVVVFRETNAQRLYLILKYPAGHFDFPKGHIEKGEEEIETALRELEEETGITDSKIVEGYREIISYTYDNNGRESHKQVIFFLVRTETENIKISHEHHDFYWLPYDAALDKLTFDNAKNLLRKAESLLS